MSTAKTVMSEGSSWADGTHFHEIDLRHMDLWAAVNDLTVGVETGMSCRQLAYALSDLLGYVTVHLADETMSGCGGGDWTDSPQLHAQGTGLMAHVMREIGLLRDDGPVAAAELLGYVRSWLEDHVAAHDGAPTARSRCCVYRP